MCEMSRTRVPESSTAHGIVLNLLDDARMYALLRPKRTLNRIREQYVEQVITWRRVLASLTDRSMWLFPSALVYECLAIHVTP
ncbi:hypothetical protein Trydic_g23822 [Trypoxylus dichotomus]